MVHWNGVNAPKSDVLLLNVQNVLNKLSSFIMDQHILYVALIMEQICFSRAKLDYFHIQTDTNMDHSQSSKTTCL